MSDRGREGEREREEREEREQKTQRGERQRQKDSVCVREREERGRDSERDVIYQTASQRLPTAVGIV